MRTLIFKSKNEFKGSMIHCLELQYGQSVHGTIGIDFRVSELERCGLGVVLGAYGLLD